ncbi:hypothetical protein [Zavarzinella formosa]|uniref:hypothetical protein n=1 Tax=Zavarzinella formosa TaxID=360055 RepID=UPI0002F6237E|nr:hypothetical protein [Zavarzinella formosa]
MSDIDSWIRDKEDASHLRCLRVVGHWIKRIHSAFGAPGDFGYGTKEGKALQGLYAVCTTVYDTIEARERPKVVCLCGSTRFTDAFREANLRETLEGKIVLTVGCDTKTDDDLIGLGRLTGETKASLDSLHMRKIDLADEILVLNVGQYIGESTGREIAYAYEHGKSIRFLEPAMLSSLLPMLDANDNPKPTREVP